MKGVVCNNQWASDCTLKSLVRSVWDAALWFHYAVSATVCNHTCCVFTGLAAQQLCLRSTSTDTWVAHCHPPADERSLSLLCARVCYLWRLGTKGILSVMFYFYTLKSLMLVLFLFCVCMCMYVCGGGGGIVQMWKSEDIVQEELVLFYNAVPGKLGLSDLVASSFTRWAILLAREIILKLTKPKVNF